MVNWGIGLEILKALSDISDVEVHCVITQYDINKLDDRWYNAVHDYAVAQKIRIIDEKNITFSQLQQIIRNTDIDLLLVHSFMRRLPEKVFSLPRYGSVNIHPSLLPKYRGPSPNYWVLKNKEKITGLTSHYIATDFDAGPIICQRRVMLECNDNVSSIIEKQKHTVGSLIRETIRKISDSNFHPLEQDESKATYFTRPQ